jgi:predicted DNA-binding transcriptional regulator AlpA
MNEPKVTKRFITASEIAEELGVCERTILNWSEAGIFPKPLRLSLRKRVWLRVEVEDHYLQQHREAQDASGSHKGA